MHRIIAAAFAALCLTGFALAADTAITIPWGDWLAELAVFAGTIILAALSWTVRRVPGIWISSQNRAAVEQLLETAIGYGVNTVAGAARGRELDVSTGSAVIDRALSYAVAHGPPALIDWAGGETALRSKIIARLTAAAEAALK
jgi:hypothetical protein